MSFSFKRPESVTFPSIWLTFKAKDKDSDELVTYTVEDLPIERHEEALQHMVTYFLADEPMCKSKEVSKEKQSLDSISTFWRAVLRQKMVLACFKEGSDEIVGLNMTGVFHKNDKNGLKLEVEGKGWTAVYDAMDYIGSKFDVFDFYKVDKYMYAYGLSVDPKYRGRGIASKILEARIPLGKAVGVDISLTLFTTIASQIPAERIGFELNYEQMYDELATVREDFNFPLNISKSLKLMSLRLKQ